jgi:Ca2+-binding RTX toxin-like protein
MHGLRRSLAGLVVMASVATACQYDPTLFAANPALSECFGTPATIGIGWFEPVDGPNGSSYVGTEGNDVVVITNGPVSFDGLGGNDRICVNDTGLASGAAPIVIDAGAGNDEVWVIGSGPVSVVVDLGEGDDFYGGVSAGDETVDAGPGEDHVVVFPLGGADDVDCGEDHDTYTFGDSVTRVNCEEHVPLLPPCFPFC